MDIKFDDEYEVFYHANGQDESYFIQSSKGLNVLDESEIANEIADDVTNRFKKEYGELPDDFEIKSVRKILK